MSVFTETDHGYLIRALELARQGLGEVSPRPSVGAVIVNDGEVVGEGRTHPVPGPHAEVAALREAGERARGGTAYVTLEPCAHTHHTGPCAEALIQAGVTRVVCPIQDPDPRVDGAGFRRLRDAGVCVGTDTPPDIHQMAADINAGFFHYTRTGQPLVTAKLACSLDGRIATRTGESQWITGPEARAAGHRMRAECDAILTGIGTMLADDPRLTACVPGISGKPRLRVVLDTEGQLPGTARMLAEPGHVIWVRGEGCEAPAPASQVEALNLPLSDGRVGLHAVLQELGRRECLSVLVESGGTLLGSFFDARLVHRVAAFIAPMVIGGADAPSAVGGTGAASLAQAFRLEDVEHRPLGDDILLTGNAPGFAPLPGSSGGARKAHVHGHS
ncbi:MAG: bifunctional diaminohydroxyphosphoribosylaminopyrimidine deaminase/5-amino-6-(5-phosphoribosylamino)uracil reductase RibD [Chloroflexota bacterium]